MPTDSGYIAPEEIIADVIQMVDDADFKKFSFGGYMSEVQQALAELALDTLFDDRVWSGPVPKSLVVDVQAIGLVNLERMFLFNGEECRAENQVTVWHAKGFTRYKAQGFKEQKGEGNNDPIMDDVMWSPGGLPYYNIVDGNIMLSDACANYQNIMLRYRGLGCPLGSAPVVPNEFRQAVKNYVAMAQLTKLFARDPQRWGAVLNNIKRDHFGGRGAMDVGTWQQAKRRVRTLDMKEMQDHMKYMSHMYAPKY